MNTFLHKCSIFSLGLITIAIAIILFTYYDNIDKDTSLNHNIISLQTKSSYDSLDILFVGNSYCYSSINTNYLDSLNISTFNLGIATAGVQFYDLIVNDYFNNITVAPQKVLILVTPMTFSSKSDNFSAYPIHRYLEDEKSNLEVALKYHRINELISMSRKSFKKSFGNCIGSELTHQTKERSNNKGYHPIDNVLDEKTISTNEYLYLPLRTEKFDRSKIADIIKIAERIKERGSEVTFFELPTNHLKNYFSKNYLSEYDNGLLRLRNSFTLISLDPTIFNENNYRNIDHMNSSGATIATKELIELLE